MNDQTNERAERIDQRTGEILAPSPYEVALYNAAEVGQEVATARQYPRRSDPVIAREIVSRATLNEEIASECVYNLPRDNKLIPGPSIRFAEIVRASFWNVRVASKYVGVDTSDPLRAAVIVAAKAYDAQTNSSEEIFEYRSIMTSGKGGKVPRIYDQSMISQTAGAARSIARRNAILALVPKALWIDGYHSALATAKGTEKTLATRRDAAFDAFGKLKIPEADVCAALGIKERNEVTLEHMLQLMSMWTALKEGEPVEAVLGRSAERPEPKNPLADRPKPPPAKPALDDYGQPIASGTPIADQYPSDSQDRVAQTQQKQTAETGQKIDKAPGPRGEAADESSGQGAAQQRDEPKNAQAARPPQDLRPSGDYYAGALAEIANTTSATKLRDWWKRTRPAREQAALATAQLDQLREQYEAKLDALRGE